MADIAVRAERDFDYAGWGSRLGRLQASQRRRTLASHDRITAAISAAAWRAAAEPTSAAIIACTNSGATARAISRFRPTAPIIAATPSATTARQLSVAWGIRPMLVDPQGSTDDIVWFAVKAAVERGLVDAGERGGRARRLAGRTQRDDRHPAPGAHLLTPPAPNPSIMDADRWTRRGRLGLGALLVVAGVLHFVVPSTFVRIIPAAFPAGWDRPLVFASGAAELAGGAGLLAPWPGLRRWAGWFVAALLVAVFPANIQMAIDTPNAVSLLRLPLQAPLIWAAIRVARPARSPRS